MSPAGEVDDGEAAARLGVARGQAVIEREAGEGPVLARQRQADDRMAAGEGEAARIAGAESDRLEPPRRRIDDGRTRRAPELSSQSRPP